MHYQVEIGPGVNRLTTFIEARGIGFNQYLIIDEKPALVSTGSVDLYPAISGSVRQLLKTQELAYVIIPHFESDECGALPQFLEEYPEAKPVCSGITARQLKAFGICDAPEVVGENDVLPLGRSTLRFITVPWEMHLWDGLVAFEETRGILFSSDLLGQLGPYDDSAPDMMPRAVAMTLDAVPSGPRLKATLEKLMGLPIRIIAPGHGLVISTPSSYFEALSREIATGGIT